MKRNKRSAPALLLVMTLLATLFTPSGVANATSDYDDVIAVTDSVVLKRGSYQQDVSYSYENIISTCGNWSAGAGAYDIGCVAFATKFSEAMNSGGSWFVTVREAKVVLGIGNQDVAVGDRFVVFGVNEAASSHADFTGSGANARLQLRSVKETCAVYLFVTSQYSPVVATSSCTTGNNEGGEVSRSHGYALWSSYVWFVNSSIAYPNGYAGLYPQADAPVSRYVAMGDSFSTGHGVGSYEYGTMIDGVNECRRSTLAYPRLLQQSMNIGSAAFVACSGATTASVLHGGTSTGAWNEPPQVNALSDETEIVTLSVGGNDVGFDSYVLGCVVACGPGTPVYAAMMAGINTAFQSNLKITYETILSKAPEAEVYVFDYPYMSSDEVSGCMLFDLSGARNVQQLMNATISNAILEVGSSRLHFVPTNYSGSPFENRHLCTEDSRGSAFDLLTMHPDIDGVEAYEEVLTTYLS